MRVGSTIWYFGIGTSWNAYRAWKRPQHSPGFRWIRLTVFSNLERVVQKKVIKSTVASVMLHLARRRKVEGEKYMVNSLPNFTGGLPD